jgi:hypothetical protein
LPGAEVEVDSLHATDSNPFEHRLRDCLARKGDPSLAAPGG